MPAYLVGGALTWPLGFIWPTLPEWASMLSAIILVPFLWFLIGAWGDKKLVREKNEGDGQRVWSCLLVFMVICAAAASVPESVGGYTNWVVFGVAIWSVVGLLSGRFLGHRAKS